MRDAVARPLLVTVIFAVLSIVGTYPLVTDMWGSLAGLPNGDQGELVNAIWWAAEALKLGDNPANFRLLAWPHGYFHPVQMVSLYPALAALPFSVFVSPVFAYNASVLIGYVLACVSGWWLCLEVTGSSDAALVGGAVFGFLPARVAHVMGGHLELGTVYLFPVFAVLLIRLLRSGRRNYKIALVGGLALALCMMVHPVYSMTFVVPLTLAIAIGFLPSGRRRREALIGLGTMIGVAMVVLIPFYTPLVVDILGGGDESLAQGGIVEFSASLAGFFTPSAYHPVWGLRELTVHVGFFWENEVYMGLVAIALSTLALGRREAVPWLWLGVASVVLALGPYLKFGDEPVRLQVRGEPGLIPLPHALLSVLPLLNLSRAPARFVMTAGLALAVMTSIGVSRILEVRAFRPYGAWIAVVLAVLVFIDSMVAFPFPVTPVEVPDGVWQMREVPGAVVTVPARRYEAVQLAMLYQTVHGRPMTGGYRWRNLEVGVGLDSLLSAFVAPENDVIPTPLPRELAALAIDSGVTTLLVLYYPSWAPAVRERIEAALGMPDYRGGGVAVFDLRGQAADVDRLLFAFDPISAGELVESGGVVARRFSDPLRLFIYAPNSMYGQFELAGFLEAGCRRLRAELNDDVVAVWRMGNGEGVYRTPGVELMAGINELVLSLDDPRVVCDCWCRHAELRGLQFFTGGDSVVSHPLDVRLGDSVRFLGYEIGEDAFSPGDVIELELIWQAIDRPEDDYVRFVHLVAEDGSLVSQVDGYPVDADGEYPTSEWEPDEMVGDIVRLPVPEDASPGSYALYAGMYRYPSIERLPISGADGRPGAEYNLIWLAEVEVRTD